MGVSRGVNLRDHPVLLLRLFSLAQTLVNLRHRIMCRNACAIEGETSLQFGLRFGQTSLRDQDAGQTIMCLKAVGAALHGVAVESLGPAPVFPLKLDFACEFARFTKCRVERNFPVELVQGPLEIPLTLESEPEVVVS